MTRKQRFMTALRGGVPDMVPVSPLIHNRYAHAVLGRTGWEAMFEVHQMIGSIHHRGNGHIGVKIRMPEGYRHETTDIERSPDGRVTTETLWHTPYGTLRSRETRGMIPHDPMVGKTVEYYVKSEEDWKTYRRIVEDRLAGLGAPEWDDYLRVAEMFGEEAVAAVNLPTPFVNLMQMRGMQQILTDIYDCPDLLQSIVELERELARKQIEAFLTSPCEVGWQDICWATGASMGPKAFEQWCLPDVVMAADMVRSVPGKYTGLYTLGRIRDLMPMFADAGVHFVETFEPNQGDITLAAAKRLYGKRMCLMGNFDSTILSFGTVEDARMEALRCLREGMEGGGYVLITGDEVPADTKMENLRAMVEAVEEHGRYDT
ncbi:MAG: hypothetical protein JSV65_06960 [Armatimonadota bacterium]|nr:MAG: hypothetical protein JSV65_06960 [Armatimonadota bacterium]